MIVATWAYGRNGVFQFPDGSGWFIRLDGSVTGACFLTRARARRAYKTLRSPI